MTNQILEISKNQTSESLPAESRWYLQMLQFFTDWACTDSGLQLGPHIARSFDLPLFPSRDSLFENKKKCSRVFKD